MNWFARFLEAFQASRQREAERVVRQSWRLVEEADAYERRRAVENAKIETAAASRGAMQFEPGSAS